MAAHNKLACNLCNIRWGQCRPTAGEVAERAEHADGGGCGGGGDAVAVVAVLARNGAAVQGDTVTVESAVAIAVRPGGVVGSCTNGHGLGEVGAGVDGDDAQDSVLLGQAGGLGQVPTLGGAEGDEVVSGCHGRDGVHSNLPGAAHAYPPRLTGTCTRRPPRTCEARSTSGTTRTGASLLLADDTWGRDVIWNKPLAL